MTTIWSIDAQKAFWNTMEQCSKDGRGICNGGFFERDIELIDGAIPEGFWDQFVKNLNSEIGMTKEEKNAMEAAIETAGGESASPPNLFADATSISQVINYVAGAASVCWENRDNLGQFDSNKALDICHDAEKKIEEILFREHGVIL